MQIIPGNDFREKVANVIDSLSEQADMLLYHTVPINLLEPVRPRPDRDRYAAISGCNLNAVEVWLLIPPYRSAYVGQLVIMYHVVALYCRM